MEHMKPVLPRTQADALESLLSQYTDRSESFRNDTLIREKLMGGWAYPRYFEAGLIPDIDFVYALYYGYEVEGEDDESEGKVRKVIDAISESIRRRNE